MTNLGKIVEVGDFVTVQDSGFAEYGVRNKDLVYLAGDSIVAVSEEDPYALRRIFIAAKTKDGHVLSEEKAFTIDGKRLKKVSKVKQEKYKTLMEEDFGEKEDES